MANPSKIIYLDNASTTLVDPDVLSTYNEVNKSYFGNASSIHYLGEESKRILQKGNELFLKILNLDSNYEIIYTSGATEANNLAIKGYCLKNKKRGNHIITSSIEHASILETFKQLHDEFNFDVTYIPVSSDGQISVDKIKNAIRKDTILVSIMGVNNEVGTVEPIHLIAKLLSNYPKIVFHVDAVQAFGKININYKEIDMFTISSHKIHGLKGTGALVKKKNIDLLPLLSGGGQQNNLRSGTLDVPGIISLIKAARLIKEKQIKNFDVVNNLFMELYTYLHEHQDLYHINTVGFANPYILNFSLLSKKASVVVEGLSNMGIMVSSTSACHARNETISYVVKQMNNDPLIYSNTIRVSFSSLNTLKDVDALISGLDKLIKGLKNK